MWNSGRGPLSLSLCWKGIEDGENAYPRYLPGLLAHLAEHESQAGECMDTGLNTGAVT